jgi:hypothetical protein
VADAVVFALLSRLAVTRYIIGPTSCYLARMRSAAPVSVRERVRQHRERQRNGIVVAPVLVDENTIGTLIRLHWLAERDADDATKIAAAVSAMIADASSRFLRMMPPDRSLRWKQ